MGCEIPAPFLNLRVNAMVNIVLAVLCFIFQATLTGMFPKNYYEIVGTGMWGGIIIGITAAISFKASTGDQPFLLGCNFVLAITSLVVSFTIMCMSSRSLDVMHRYPAACQDYITITYKVTVNDTIPIPPCGDYSVGHQSLSALLLVCSLVAAPVNAFLTLGVINAHSPVTASPN